MIPKINALILAGARKPYDEVAKAGGKPFKALVEIHGKPMIQYVVEALQASERVEKIIVAIPAEAGFQMEGVEILEPKESPAKTVEAAYELIGESNLLVATADHPLLNKEMLIEFVEEAALTRKDAVAGLAPLPVVMGAYPETKRTGLRFKDESYSGCNLFFLQGSRASNIIRFWQKLEDKRKSPWKMAKQVGFGVLIKYALNQLTLENAIEDLSRKAGCYLGVVMMSQAEAAIDVDKVEDLKLVTKILASRR